MALQDTELVAVDIVFSKITSREGNLVLEAGRVEVVVVEIFERLFLSLWFNSGGRSIGGRSRRE